MVVDLIPTRVYVGSGQGLGFPSTVQRHAGQIQWQSVTVSTEGNKLLTCAGCDPDFAATQAGF